MKAIMIKTLATGIVAMSLLVTGCKKGDTGATGAPGTNGYIPASSDGFIKGNIAGTRQDGTAFNESFNFNNYYGSPSGTLDSTSATSYRFLITRSTDIFGKNQAQLSINTTSPTSQTGFLGVNLSFTKSLGANKEFDFSLSNFNTTITNLTYNTSTKMFTGSLPINGVMVSGSQNSTGNNVTLSLSFEATITQLYMMVHHNNPNVVEVTKGNN